MPPFFSIPPLNASTNQKNFSTLLAVHTSNCSHDCGHCGVHVVDDTRVELEKFAESECRFETEGAGYRFV